MTTYGSYHVHLENSIAAEHGLRAPRVLLFFTQPQLAEGYVKAHKAHGYKSKLVSLEARKLLMEQAAKEGIEYMAAAMTSDYQEIELVKIEDELKGTQR